MPTLTDLRFAVVALVGALCHVAGAHAQADFPRQPIKVLVPFAAGGGNDLIARVVSQKLAERVGQPVLVENKPGGAGFVAIETLLRSPADGYTLLVAPSSVAVFNAAIYTKLSYDPLKSFVPITVTAAFPFYLTVNSGSPFKTVNDLVAYAKANPDKANYGGTSGVFQLVTEQFKQFSGAPLEYIPFKSSGELATAVINGQITTAFIDPAPLLGHIRAGRLKALASTSAKRTADLPDVPTLTELGIGGVPYDGGTGIVAPAGTPAPVVKTLETHINAVLREPDVLERFRQLSVTAVGGTSEEYAAYIARSIPIWKEVARKANLKLD